MNRKFKVGNVIRDKNDGEIALVLKENILFFDDGSYGYEYERDNDTDSGWELIEENVLTPNKFISTLKFKIGDKVEDKSGNTGIIEFIIIGETEKGYNVKGDIGWYKLEDELTLCVEPKVKEVNMQDLEELYGCKVKVVK